MNQMTLSKAEGTGALLLGGALEIYEAEALRQALLAHLAASPEPVVDLGQVEKCDTAGIQLLCSARRSAVQAGKTLRFEQVPPAVTDCLARLGLPATFLVPSAS